MKINLIIFLFLITFFNLSAQENEIPITNEFNQLMNEDKDEVFIYVQKHAEYPGGIIKFNKDFIQNFESPKIIENRIKIPVVFVIEKNGSISNIKAYNDPGYNIEECVTKAFEKMQLWQPAYHNNQPVRSQFTFPIILERVLDDSISN